MCTFCNPPYGVKHVVSYTVRLIQKVNEDARSLIQLYEKVRHSKYTGDHVMTGTQPTKLTAPPEEAEEIRMEKEQAKKERQMELRRIKLLRSRAGESLDMGASGAPRGILGNIRNQQAGTTLG